MKSMKPYSKNAAAVCVFLAAVLGCARLTSATEDVLSKLDTQLEGNTAEAPVTVQISVSGTEEHEGEYAAVTGDVIRADAEIQESYPDSAAGMNFQCQWYCSRDGGEAEPLGSPESWEGPCAEISIEDICRAPGTYVYILFVNGSSSDGMFETKESIQVSVFVSTLTVCAGSGAAEISVSRDSGFSNWYAIGEGRTIYAGVSRGRYTAAAYAPYAGYEPDSLCTSADIELFWDNAKGGWNGFDAVLDIQPVPVKGMTGYLCDYERRYATGASNVIDAASMSDPVIHFHAPKMAMQDTLSADSPAPVPEESASPRQDPDDLDSAILDLTPAEDAKQNDTETGVQDPSKTDPAPAGIPGAEGSHADERHSAQSDLTENGSAPETGVDGEGGDWV